MYRSALIRLKSSLKHTSFIVLFQERHFTDCLRFSRPKSFPSLSHYSLSNTITISFSTQQQNIYCWNCGKQLESLNFKLINCSNCGIIQPINKKSNFFNYLDIPLSFNLNQNELGNKFRQKQAIVHPDKFALKSEQELIHSQQHSTFLNDAYRTLRDPFKRAKYLVKIIEDIESEFKVSESNKFEKADNNLVIEIMELNEEIELMENKLIIKQKIKEIDSKIDKLLSSMNELLIKKDINQVRKNLQWIKFLRQSRSLLEKKKI